jgi:ketosteroid isomerase-like protein
VTEQSAPAAALARAFTKAWTGHDMTTAATYVAEDATFDSPAFRLVGKQAYLDALDAFARTVTDARIRAVFGDESQALIMYEATVGGHILTCTELLTFRDGKVVTHVGTSGVLKVRQPAAEVSSPAPIK